MKAEGISPSSSSFICKEGLVVISTTNGAVGASYSLFFYSLTSFYCEGFLVLPT